LLGVIAPREQERTMTDHPTRRLTRTLALSAAGALALAACAAPQGSGGVAQSGTPTRNAGAAPAASVPGGATRWGDTTASMAEQYVPRPGGVTVAAAGASAWVPPAPAPAFELAAPLP